MTAKDECQQDWKFRDAVVLTRIGPHGRTQYRIAPYLVQSEQTPNGGFLSNWCYTEERAWHAALCRRWNRVYSSDYGEGH